MLLITGTDTKKIRLFYYLAASATIITTFVILFAYFVPGTYSIYSSYLLAQAKGQDLVTLVFAVPLMAFALFFAYRNSTKAHFVLAGGLAYLLYTYMTYSYICYSRLLFLYAAIYAASLFGLLVFFSGLPVKEAAHVFAATKFRTFTAYYNMVLAVLIALLWLKDLLNTALTGVIPAEVLRNQGASVVYANDLGFFLPAIFLSGFLLLKNKDWGYVLTAVLLVKEISMGLAILGMICVMALDGQPVDAVMTIVFGTVTLASLTVTFLFYTAGTAAK